LTSKTPTAIERALEALRAAGWPDTNGIDLEAITADVLAAGFCADDAAQAVPAALAQLVAESHKSSTYIDVDHCTAHLLVLRDRDQVRHFSIVHVINTLAAVYGPPFLPHDNNNLH
jgi:hypothetical protein